MNSNHVSRTPAHRVRESISHNALRSIARGERLTRTDAAQLMGAIMDGAVDPLHVSGIITGLAARGEQVDEITGFATAMRQRAVPVAAPPSAVDTCGTGGDGSGTFNISTVSAFVVAACGVPVAKHGNRAVSSTCGSADVLEALGARVDGYGADAVAQHLRSVGIGFMFAPAFHPAMRRVADVRRTLGIRTIFNLLGPLTNPAGVRHQVLGVARFEHVELMARVLVQLGVERALVVHGSGGLDELSLSGPSTVCRIADGSVSTSQIDPRSLGFARVQTDALQGGSAAENAAIARSILAGARGPHRDVVLLNAAAALVAASVEPTFIGAVERAAVAIDSGAAAASLDAFVTATCASAEPQQAVELSA